MAVVRACIISEGVVLDKMDKTTARARSSRGGPKLIPCFERGSECTTVRAASVVDGDILQISERFGETAAFNGTEAKRVSRYAALSVKVDLPSLPIELYGERI